MFKFGAEGFITTVNSLYGKLEIVVILNSIV